VEHGELDVGPDRERIDEFPLAADPREPQLQELTERGTDLEPHSSAECRLVPESEVGRVPFFVVIAPDMRRAQDAKADISAPPVGEGAGLRPLRRLAHVGQLARKFPLEASVAWIPLHPRMKPAGSQEGARHVDADQRARVDLKRVQKAARGQDLDLFVRRASHREKLGGLGPSRARAPRGNARADHDCSKA